MKKELNYSDHVSHYITDARVSDYFNPGKAEQQAIRRRYQLFASLLSFKKGDRFAEIGSGGGEALNIVKKAGINWYPADLSHENLRTILHKSAGTSRPSVSDIYHLPFRDNSFDKMIVSEVLEHLEKPGDALQEIHRTLKSKGVVTVSVPYREKISYHLCVHCNQLTPSNAHLHSFDEKKLAEMSVAAGFRVKKVLTFSNKLGQMLHYNQLLKPFPFIMWRTADSLLNLFIPKKSHMLLVLVK